MNALRVAYRLALLTFPRDFRQRFGGDMLAAFETTHGASQTGLRAPVERRFALRAITDVAVQGIRRRIAGPPTEAGALRRQAPWINNRTPHPLDTLMRDLVFALRSLRRRPTLAFAVILTLTVGIGASTAMFSLMDGVLFRPLPYPQADQLVAVQQRDTRTAQSAAPVSPANYLDLRESTTTIEDLAGTLFRVFSPTIRLGEDPAFQAQVLTVTYNLFDVLRVAPIMGRSFDADEARPGGPATIILSHEFWTRVFGASPEILGEQITVSGQPREIIGVMPEGFYVEGPADMWLPMSYDPDVHFALAAEVRHIGMLNLIGRLAPDHTVEHARDELQGMFAELGRMFPEENVGIASVVRGAKERQVGSHRRTLWLLGAAVAAMLLIAALNMAVLLVASAASRGTEIATRLALGSGRGRLVVQGLLESLLLTGAGAVGGGFLATFLVNGILGALPEALPRQSEIAIDVRAWAFGFVTALLTGAIFGLLPLTLHLRAAPIQALRARSTAGSGTARLRQGLIVVEVALAFVLLIGSGFLLTSLSNALAVDPGFTTRDVFTTETAVPAADADTTAGRSQHFAALAAELRSIPGVMAVGYSSRTPFRGGSVETGLEVEGQPATPDKPNRAEFRRAGPNFFATLEMPLLEGRTFDGSDTPDGDPVVIINDTARRQFFDGSPVGRRVRWGDSDRWHSVVGVVGDIRYFGLDSPATPELYISSTQAPNSSAAIFVRLSGETSTTAPMVIGRIKQANPAEPVSQLQAMDDLVSQSLSPRRLPALLVAGFGLFALLLSAMGLYGVLAYLVEERSAEIGIRMALGARPGVLLRGVVGDGLRVAATGILLGLPFAIMATRAVASMLFEVGASDPSTFLGIGVLLLAVAALSSLVAGRRATSVDPASALDRT